MCGPGSLPSVSFLAAICYRAKRKKTQGYPTENPNQPPQLSSLLCIVYPFRVLGSFWGGAGVFPLSFYETTESYGPAPGFGCTPLLIIFINALFLL